MIHLNGELLSRDTVIAKIENGLITESNHTLLPMYLSRTGDMESWLADRAIDGHRTNSRILKKALRLSGRSDAELVLKVHAATITDSYWFRENGSGLSYEDVRFKVNLFDKLALSGDPDSFNQPYSPTPELTNIGSFEKCWRLENGKWWLIKRGSEPERFAELFVCRLGQALGFPMAAYLPDGGTVKSPDFTDGAAVNYEAADGIVGGDEDYTVNFAAFWKLSPDIARQYLQIIYMDTLCFNMDRHTKNYGVLRDAKTGVILSMASNFDNNIALFARGVPQDLSRAKDKLISLYCELLEDDIRALEIAKNFHEPTPDMIERCVGEIPIPIDIEPLRAFILNGGERIQCQMRRIAQRHGRRFS